MRFVKKILDVLPVPFWVYFFSIVAGTIGVLPHQSPAYDWTTRHMLPAAIILMLIGAPVTELVAMGPKALVALAIGTVSIWIAQIFAYIIMFPLLPAESWRSVGALMGTWIGGSANMVAIKEILQLPDSNLSVLVIVDTVISYGWMALLLSGAKLQSKLNFEKPGERFDAPTGTSSTVKLTPVSILGVLAVGFLVGESSIFIGGNIAQRAGILSAGGWSLLTASTVAIALATTPLRRLKTGGTQTIGTLLLYLVLITIGAKTTLDATLQSPVFLLYGALVMLLHGILALGAGKIFHIPLFLLSTSSQANIGGAVSAPIVAEAYRPGTAHIGVLMAVAGAVLGTYLGVAGGSVCRLIETWLR